MINCRLKSLIFTNRCRGAIYTCSWYEFAKDVSHRNYPKFSTDRDLTKTLYYHHSMNSMTSKGTSHKSLMEAIALLYMINQCPESPRDNQPPQSLTSLSASYQLPLQREKEIVDNLAFLSATTNDSTRVMAVCLEEDRGRDSCTIRLTSNTGDLHEVVNGFNHMARILERAASRGSFTQHAIRHNCDQLMMFQLIVEMMIQKLSFDALSF